MTQTEVGPGSDSFELIQKAQLGDEPALEQLFERYYPRVRRIVEVRLGRRLSEYVECDDILQETFIAAVRSFRRFERRNESSLILWLSRIAENQIRRAAAYCGSLRRDRRRERALRDMRKPVQGSSELVFDPASLEPSPLAILEAEEDIELVQDCLSGLSEQYREAIIHRWFAGASWDEVAHAIGCPSAVAARSLCSRALAQLVREVGRKRQP